MTGARFIAGAVCPACGECDVIRIPDMNAPERIECVNCGFSSASAIAANPVRVLDASVPGNAQDDDNDTT